MTKKEREILKKVVGFFEYHNKNLTKEQDWQIYQLQELLKKGA